MKHTIICDIDGTIADLSHRLHHIKPETEPIGLDRYKRGKKNWDAFHAEVGNDGEHSDITHILSLLMAQDHHRLVYVTGRMEKTRRDTLNWLYFRNLGFERGIELYMRPDDDYRPDFEVKEEILDKLKLTPADVLCVLDDRDQVVQMWRRRGFRVLQVANGDFTEGSRVDDKRLLEAAARAAGIESFGTSAVDGVSICRDPVVYWPWNPLNDDGDALRLAVKLRMTVQCSFASVWVETAIPELEIVENHNNGDPLAATRRAIVRAAAAIGGYRE